MVVIYIFALVFINWKRQSNKIKAKSELDEALRGSPMVEVEDYSTKWYILLFLKRIILTKIYIYFIYNLKKEIKCKISNKHQKVN